MENALQNTALRSPTVDAEPGLAGRLDAYEPVARAIDYLVAEFDNAPRLEDVANHVGLSPAHFQRVFKAGAGVSPKRFLQHLSLVEARRSMAEGAGVMEAAFAAGLSGPSRLHDLCLVGEAMTPGAVRRRGEGETIRYGWIASPFGAALIGATSKGVCWLSFADEADGGRARSLREMKEDWSGAAFVEDNACVAPLAAAAFAQMRGDADGNKIGLHVEGTNFQLKVWAALLRIPVGETVSYGDLARAVGAPSAARAVGAAVGANKISVLIPCHRVIRASGAVHNYRWGANRKRALLALENAQIEAEAAA